MILPPREVEHVVQNTVAVLTTHVKQREEWQKIIADALAQVTSFGDELRPEAEFFAAILAVLSSLDSSDTEGGGPLGPVAGLEKYGLPPGHPYADAWAAVLAGVRNSGGKGPALSDEQVEFAVYRTAEVLTTNPAGRAEWRSILSDSLAEAQNMGQTDDAEFLTALLAMLESPGRGSRPQRRAGKRSGPVGKRSPSPRVTLPPDHNYTAALALVQAIVESGGPSGVAVSPATMRIVRDLLTAQDLATARRVIETHADVLLSPKVEALFEANIAASRSLGEEEEARVLVQALAVLRACRDHGIAAIFDDLE